MRRKWFLASPIITALLFSCGSNNPVSIQSDRDISRNSTSSETYVFSNPVSFNDLKGIIGNEGFTSVEYIVAGTYGSYQQSNPNTRSIEEASKVTLEVINSYNFQETDENEEFARMLRLRSQTFRAVDANTKMIFSFSGSPSIKIQASTGMRQQSQNNQSRPDWVNKEYQNFYTSNSLNSSTLRSSSNKITAQANVGWQPTGTLTVNGNGLTGTSHRTYAKSTLAWSPTTLAALKELKIGVYNLDAYEQDFGVYGDSKQYFNSCVSNSDLPAGYSDCVTAGVLENTGSSYTFGSFDNNQFVANRTYTGTTTLFGSAAVTSSLNGSKIESNLVSQAVHCYSQNAWQCGLTNLEKMSAFLLRQAATNSKFNTYTQLPYSY